MTFTDSVAGLAYRIVTPRLVIQYLEPANVSMSGVAVEESLETLLISRPMMSSKDESYISFIVQNSYD
jgi:hypothetical protein